MGAEFCFTPDHCLNLEGDYRYLSFERNIVTNSTGAAGGVRNNTKGPKGGQDKLDLNVRLGGVIFLGGDTQEI